MQPDGLHQVANICIIKFKFLTNTLSSNSLMKSEPKKEIKM